MLSHIQGFATTAKSSRLNMQLLIIRHVHVNHVTVLRTFLGDKDIPIYNDIFFYMYTYTYFANIMVCIPYVAGTEAKGQARRNVQT